MRLFDHVKSVIARFKFFIPSFSAHSCPTMNDHLWDCTRSGLNVAYSLYLAPRSFCNADHPSKDSSRSIMLGLRLTLVTPWHMSCRRILLRCAPNTPPETFLYIPSVLAKNYELLSNLFIPTFDITTKFVITTVWMEGWRIPQLKNTVLNTSRNICCGYLLESPRWGDSNKYPQHTFLGV